MPFEGSSVAHFADGEADTQKAELAPEPKSLTVQSVFSPRLCTCVCARVLTPQSLLSAVCARWCLGWDELLPPWERRSEIVSGGQGLSLPVDGGDAMCERW